MEVLADVDLGPEALRAVALRHRGCLGWGGRSDLAPADDVLISVERPLSIDSREQMVASILAKKLAAGSTHLLLDIPVGPTAKIRDQRAALALRKLFEYVGDRCGIEVEVVISDGRQPIGNGVGPVLEARDAMGVLEGGAEAPVDLRERSLRLAGRILEFDPDVRGGQGYVIARDILDSGRALARMNDIIEAQGRREHPPRLGALSETVPASFAGRVASIDCFRIARIARLAGAPLSKGAGVDLCAKIGDRVSARDPLYRVHAEYPAGLTFACAEVAKNNGYVIVED
jgi:thymidine phosphorylase